MNARRLWTVGLVLALALALWPARIAYAQIYYVGNANDSGLGSLRDRIEVANAHAGPDIIRLNIGGPAPHVIHLVSALPVLTDDGTTIDGYYQPDSDEAAGAAPATITVVLDGTDAGASTHGLRITSANNVIKGLAFIHFGGSGISIVGAGATNNLITGNHIGTDTYGGEDLGNAIDGVMIGNGATRNTVGGDEAEDRNVISGNTHDGVSLFSTGTTTNTVMGNRIGLAPNGLDRLANHSYGVHILSGASNNTIGGTATGQRNVISGNSLHGVFIEDPGTSGNTIRGNTIGPNWPGLAEVGNGFEGVALFDGAHHNTIGPGNLISGNHLDGVYLIGTGTANNVVTGNLIGVNSFGTTHLENALNGVVITDGATWNTIGPGNVISGNHLDGISIGGVGSANNLVIGNIVGLDYTGSAEVRNHRYGLVLGGTTHDNTVGGDSAAERNVISSNGSYGILIAGAPVAGNVVSGNIVGLNAAGTAARGNMGAGVAIGVGAHDNLIGGDSQAEANVISGNLGDGVLIGGPGTTGNVVSGNIVGSDPAGTADMGNTGMGVTISGGAQDNLIGGDVVAEMNFIGHNAHGVWIRDAGTNGNTVSYNGIAGADFHGVYITIGAQHNTIGPFNIIAQNSGNGVYVEEATTRDNVVTHNSIYANAHGIALEGGANNTIPTPGVADIRLAGGAVNILGKSCAACTVEAFTNHDNDGEGETYLGTTAANASGWFTLTVSSLVQVYQTYVTVTSTRAGDGTSEFSTPYTSTLQPLFVPGISRNP